MAAGEFDSANTENGIRILGKAIKEVEFYEPIRALLSDNGSEFSSHWKHKKRRFNRYISEASVTVRDKTYNNECKSPAD
jgi:transposase InsO family protein